MIVPVSCWVWALNALQNSMMFTPCWPSAGPTGGAGLAAPAGICSLIRVRTFFAIGGGEDSGRPAGGRPPVRAGSLRRLVADRVSGELLPPIQGRTDPAPAIVGNRVCVQLGVDRIRRVDVGLVRRAGDLHAATGDAGLLGTWNVDLNPQYVVGVAVSGIGEATATDAHHVRRQLRRAPGVVEGTSPPSVVGS